MSLPRPQGRSPAGARHGYPWKEAEQPVRRGATAHAADAQPTPQAAQASSKSPVAKAVARPRGNDDPNILTADMKFLKNVNHEISTDLQHSYPGCCHTQVPQILPRSAIIAGAPIRGPKRSSRLRRISRLSLMGFPMTRRRFSAKASRTSSVTCRAHRSPRPVSGK